MSVVFAGLVGGILWNLFTWYRGLPSSSSHTLIGGTVGAALVASGLGAVSAFGILTAVLLPAVVAPLLAASAALFTWIVYRFTHRLDPEKARRGFRWGQVGSGSLVALAHGTKDAQKMMGVIVLALVSYGSLPSSGFEVPAWVILSAASAIALGTYFGGWRIIRTVGHRVTDIEPPQGFSAETASATVILGSSALGFPLSTTHVTSGGVAGSGLGRFGKLRAVRREAALNIVLAWLLTLPGAALIPGLAAVVVALGADATGIIVVGVLPAAITAALWWAPRPRRPGERQRRPEGASVATA